MPYHQVPFSERDAAHQGLSVEYVQPTPAQPFESLDGIVEDEERRQPNFYAALAHLATDACINEPDNLEFAQGRIDRALTAHFHPRLGMPTKADASNRIWLAGTMGATHLLVAHYACVSVHNDVSDGKSLPDFAPPGYYAVEGADIEGPPQVVLYDEGTAEDMHMRAVVKAMVDAALSVRQRSWHPDSPFGRYASVFKLGYELRAALPDEPIKGSPQRKTVDSSDGLYPEEIRTTSAQFARNVMHGIMLLTADQPRKHIGSLRSLVRENITAIEMAALYPRNMQRAYMGIPGEPYESIRRTKNITPQVIEIDGKLLRIRGLEAPPHVATMCSGAGSHTVPIGFGSQMGSKYPISVISKYVDLALKIAPATLFRDVPRRMCDE